MRASHWRGAEIAGGAGVVVSALRRQPNGKALVFALCRVGLCESSFCEGIQHFERLRVSTARKVRDGRDRTGGTHGVSTESSCFLRATRRRLLSWVKFSACRFQDRGMANQRACEDGPAGWLRTRRSSARCSSRSTYVPPECAEPRVPLNLNSIRTMMCGLVIDPLSAVR